MSDEKLTEDELDALFDAARRRLPEPSSDWLARVVADAEREMAVASPAPPPSLWAQITQAVGGWQGVGGMAVACATGLWIGIAPPDLLGDPVSLALGAGSTVDVISDTPFAFAGLLEEG